jgi:hypothetical protein
MLAFEVRVEVADCWKRVETAHAPPSVILSVAKTYTVNELVNFLTAEFMFLTEF